MEIEDGSLLAIHVISGDVWAGAEVQVSTLLSQLHRGSGIRTVAVLFNHGELESQLNEAGIEVAVVDETQLSSLQIARKLRRRFIELRPDVIHSHGKKENVLSSIANWSSVRVPTVRTQHGAKEHEPGIQQITKLFSDTVERLTALLPGTTLVAVSSAMAEQLVGQYGADRVVVIENGVDVEALRRHQQSLRFPNGCVQVGFLGRLEAVKQPETFLQIASTLVRDHPDRSWCFHIFGGGSLENHLKQICRDLNLSTNTIFHGHDPTARYRICNLDVIVNCSAHEGLPISILEGLAIGVPVVVADVGGLRQLIEEFGGGLVVRGWVPEDYATAIVEALSAFPTISEAIEDETWIHSAHTNAIKFERLYTEMRKSTVR